MGWKPRENYNIAAERHSVILTRCKMQGQYLPAPPMTVVWREGHFYPVPGIPMFVGNGTCGWMINDHFDEWMEIPE